MFTGRVDGAVQSARHPSTPKDKIGDMNLCPAPCIQGGSHTHYCETNGQQLSFRVSESSSVGHQTRQSMSNANRRLSAVQGERKRHILHPFTTVSSPRQPRRALSQGPVKDRHRQQEGLSAQISSGAASKHGVETRHEAPFCSAGDRHGTSWNHDHQIALASGSAQPEACSKEHKGEHTRIHTETAIRKARGTVARGRGEPATVRCGPAPFCCSCACLHTALTAVSCFCGLGTYAPHMHVLVCICSNARQLEIISYGHYSFAVVLALEPILSTPCAFI